MNTRDLSERLEDASCRLEGVSSVLTWLACAEEGDTDEPNPQIKASAFRLLRGVAEDASTTMSEAAGEIRDRARNRAA